MTYISLLLLFCCANVIESNKYGFGVFENAKALKDIYSSEVHFHKSLQTARDVLTARRDFLLRHRNDSTAMLIPELSSILNQPNTEMIGPSSYERTKRGFLVLLDTYKLDQNALLRGVLRDKSRSFEIKSREKLTSQDILDLSKEAFNFNWFDSSINLLHTYLKHKNDSSTDSFRKRLVELHNLKLRRNLALVGEDFKVFPYMIDPLTLRKKKKQPKIIARTDFFNRNVSHLPSPSKLNIIVLKSEDSKKFDLGEKGDEEFRRVCREEIKTPQDNTANCILLHHNDPYLRLGPFKLEIVSKDPPRMILVDFFTEKEISYLKTESYPHLSMGRTKEEPKKQAWKSNKVRVVQKSVQHWLKDIVYNQKVNISIIRGPYNRFDSRFPDWFTEDLPQDLYGFKVVSPLLYSLSHKIEMATRLKIKGRWGSSEYQVTNYGLGGLCELHLDPHGMLMGAHVPGTRADLFRSGDMIMTLMGWLEDVAIGGSTAFIYPGREALFRPAKGSAAIWFNLHRNGQNNRATIHGGCPVVGGTKWILNKWTYYFNQMHNYPCGLDEFEDYKVFDNNPNN